MLYKDVPILLLGGFGIVLVTVLGGIKFWEFVQRERNKVQKPHFEELSADMDSRFTKLCSKIERNREDLKTFRESLEILEKTAFLEGQMAAQRGT